MSGQIQRIVTNELLPGDFDADGNVDQDDYTKWRAGHGGTNPNPASDGNSNATFDASDYVAWRKNFGASVLAGAGSGTGAAVPEPTTIILMAQFGISVLLLTGSVRLRLPANGSEIVLFRSGFRA